MKITVEYTVEENPTEQLKVVSAKCLSDYAIRLKFNDGKEQLVDFKPFLLNSNHPSIRKYLDEHAFSNFSLVDGNLNWNDYEMIFPIMDLYNGNVV